MKKKFLALVLTLAMVLSLAPVSALAVDEGAQGTHDVITYRAGTPQTDYPEGLTTLDKQAKKINDNQYQVTLTVGMSQKTETVVTSQEAATVLVIDISNSMGCTKEEHKHNELCYNQCTPESKPEHWNNLGWGNYSHKIGYDCWLDRELNYHYTGEQTLTCTKEEHSYNDNCHTRLTDAKDAARAFVETYAGTQEGTGRNLSIVLFNYNPSVKLDWTDVSTSAGKNKALQTIQNITLGKYEDGGTNLKGGLSAAGEKLRDTAVTNLARDNKNVIVLTDGAPTQPTLGGGSAGSASLNKETANEATNLKKRANIYTICFGAKNEKTYDGRKAPTVGDFLRDSIASSASNKTYAYNADKASELNKAFEEISKTITSGLSAGKVHDALPEGVTSSDADFTADWDLSSFTKTEEKNGDRTDYTYIKTYTVTIDPDEIDSTVLEENKGYYPLNDRTTLTVKTGDTNTVLDFPIPAGKVTAKITYVLDDGQNAASNPETYVCGVGVDSFADATKTGYTFGGWYSDSSYTNKVTNISKTEVGNKTLYAKWEKDGSQTKKLSYTVEYYKDNEKVVGDTQTVTKDVWVNATTLTVDKGAINTTDKYAGYKFDKTEPGTIPGEVTGGTAIKVYYVKDEVKNIINQHFMDGKGKERDDLRVNGEAQMKPKDTPLSDLIEGKTGPQSKENKNYVYVSSKTTYTVDQVTNPLNADSKLTKDTTIDLYYYLDNWKDGDSKTPTADDSATGGDGIPDCYQVLVNYKSGDTNRGSVGPRTMEVLTIKSNDVYASEGQVVASGSTANATGSRCYFSNWTDTTGKQVDTNATLGQQTIENAKGGDVYTFTANFGRSSGGSNRPKPPVVEIPDDVPTGLNGKDHYAYVVGYPDGMVYPQKNITRAEVATIFFRLLEDETREANMTKSNSYNDMKDGAWYTCAVSTLSKMGIIKGYEDGSFKPDASISRAEFAAIAARFDPDGDTTPATFSDVSSHWAKDEISIAANHGWIKGYEDGSFKPDQKITRAETMTLVNRVLKRLPETKDDLHKDMKTWPDNQNESAWFYLAVQEATNSHYQKLKKDGTHETWESMRETRDWAALEK